MRGRGRYRQGGSGALHGAVRVLRARLIAARSNPRSRGRATTCIALVGDGAFLMHGAEVSTAARYRAGAIWVVLYDDDLSMVSQGQQHFFPDPQQPDIWTELYALGSPDVAKVAEGYGADAYEAHSPAELQRLLPQLLDRAAGGKPQVVVAHVERRSVPPYYNPQY